jgi:hypothetical protein
MKTSNTHTKKNKTNSTNASSLLLPSEHLRRIPLQGEKLGQDGVEGRKLKVVIDLVKLVFKELLRVGLVVMLISESEHMGRLPLGMQEMGVGMCMHVMGIMVEHVVLEEVMVLGQILTGYGVQVRHIGLNF